MGQCVSRGHPGSYAFSRHYDSASLGSLSSGPHRHTWGGIGLLLEGGLLHNSQNHLPLPVVPFDSQQDHDQL
ncbi:unnamed protein product [Plutella xylostella]|uniref:(diamondback moth) hypothetical protein n=1 Tax=Plutella xylostella TaxID=51655 RepID=A0A8S4FZN1_PLUXY|nr:unnamed protein product [Plutella xylostella]